MKRRRPLWQSALLGPAVVGGWLVFTPAALWAIDTTPPTAPGQPIETASGSGPDVDYIYTLQGVFVVSWTAATDPESAITAYELQEKKTTTGTWTTLSSTLTTTQFQVTNQLSNTQYFYHVRAKNAAGLWGAWSADSDGVLIDGTPPSAVTVTDDGNYTNSTTSLHATWTASSDAESGITDYQYVIRQDSTLGTIIVPQTSAGLVTQVTRTGLALTNGKTYYIGVSPVNGAGRSAIMNYSNGITVDTVAPTVTISAPANGVIVSGTSVSVNATVVENNSMGTVQFKLDGANLGALDATSPYSVTWDTTTASNGSHTLTAIAQDSAGNIATSAPITVTVNNAAADTTLPTGTVTINGGAASTNTTAATLTLSATDNSGSVAQMQFSNDGTTYSAVEAYATSKTWTLATGDGTKTVYAKFKDAAGNWSTAATDTIVLDTTPPTISAQTASGITSSAASITWTTSESATSQVEYGTTASYGQTTALDSTLTTSHIVALSTLSAGTLYHYRARSKDALGNERLGADATFTTTLPADITPPTGSLTINGGAASTRNTAVTLTLSATDDRGTVAQMRFSNDGTTYTTAEAYATSKTWTLNTGDGAKTISVKFADPAGNWSTPVSATITLDTTPPTINFTSPTDGQVIVAP